jgi:hypothetical protein
MIIILVVHSQSLEIYACIWIQKQIEDKQEREKIKKWKRKRPSPSYPKPSSASWPALAGPPRSVWRTRVGGPHPAAAGPTGQPASYSSSPWTRILSTPCPPHSSSRQFSLAIPCSPPWRGLPAPTCVAPVLGAASMWPVRLARRGSADMVPLAWWPAANRCGDTVYQRGPGA